MQTSLKVGALAKQTGLTVRTLHHYDEIGLLSPGERTPSGHRLYGAEELSRLQQITSLKQLGLSLDEIRDCLQRPEYTLEGVLDLQVERLEERIREQRRLQETIATLRDRMRAGEALTIDELARTVRLTVRISEYFTAEQLETMAVRRESVGAERMEAVGREWGKIFEGFASAMERGLDPASAEVQALARRSAELVEEFTGGDPGIRASLGEMYASEGPDQVLQAHGMPMPPGVWEYMAAAREAAG